MFDSKVWNIITAVGTIAGVIVSLFAIQDIFEKRLKEELTVQSEHIINEIENKADALFEFQKDDLWDRIQLLKTEIETQTEHGQEIPERKRIHLRSMMERYDEMKNPWNEK